MTTRRFQRGVDMRYSQDQTNFQSHRPCQSLKRRKLKFDFTLSLWRSHTTKGGHVIILSRDLTLFPTTAQLSLTVGALTDGAWLTSQWQLTWRETQGWDRWERREDQQATAPHTESYQSAVVIICSSAETTSNNINNQHFSFDEFFTVCLKSSTSSPTKIPVCRYLLRLSESVPPRHRATHREEVSATFLAFCPDLVDYTGPSPPTLRQSERLRD